METKVVIIGSGHSGGMAAIMLRKQKFKGSITIIGEENYMPYERPALSKGFLLKNINKERLYIKSDEYYRKNDIKLILNSAVIEIDRFKKSIALDNGKVIFYSVLIIATGSKLREFKKDINSQHIYYLRGLDDSIKIKSLMINKKNLGIIGSGYIGLEIASVAAQLGLSVTVLEQENRVLSRVASKKISDFFKIKHEKMGVKFKLNTFAKNIEKGQGYLRIICSDNSHINVDFILVCIGVKPDIELAIKSGLKVDNGITVDENCVTSDKDILAIGDCTNHPNKIVGSNLRLESVHNAVEQAKTASSYIVGKKKPYKQVPWFWSDQYDVKLQIAGITKKGDKKFLSGKPEKEKFSVFSFRKSKLVAVESINSPKDFVRGKRIIESQIKFSNRFLTKENFNLETCIKMSLKTQ